MVQSSTTKSKPKASKLAVVYFLLGLFPVLCAVVVLVIVFHYSWGEIFFASAIGIPVWGLVSIYAISRGAWKLKVRTLVLISIGFSIIFFYWMGSWIESYKRMQWRAREGDVKSVALQLNLGVEDFKPKHMGIRPASLKDIESLLSVGYVKKRKNPFNSKQTYSFAGGGLVDGYPSQNGVIGYITPQDSSEPYRIVVYTTFPGLGKWDTFQLVEKTTK